MSNILAKIQSVGHPLITRQLDMGEFDAAYAGATFDVIVLPPPELLAEYGAAHSELQKASEDDGADKQQAMDTWEAFRVSWYSKLWTNITEDEVQQIKDALPEMAWEWLLLRTSEMTREYRESKLKN